MRILRPLPILRVKAGQSLTSNLSDIARENGAEIVATDGFNQAMDLLTSGRIDATVNDGLSYLDLKNKNQMQKLKWLMRFLKDHKVPQYS